MNFKNRFSPKISTFFLFLTVLMFSSCAHLRTSKDLAKSNSTSQKIDADSSDETAATEEETDTSSSDLAESEETPEDIGDLNISNTVTPEEIKADADARKTFPLVSNEFVDQWIRYFTGRGRRHFERYMARSTRFIPMMQEVLKKDGLPPDLIYLAMIESGFNTKAKSKAKAVGPWQFIKSTGERYGMTVDYWVDERRDFQKSTHAAAMYLKELQQIFGSWYLAAAAYNAGEGKVLMAVRRDRSRNFWELIRRKKNFRAETRNYVPKMIAAALISKNPKQYGFDDIPFEQPLTWETLDVPGGLSLKTIAKVLEVDLDELSLLNSELRRNFTPPNRESYPLRVPVGKASILQAKLGDLKTQKLPSFEIHVVKRGETISAIARKYRVSIEDILETNGLSRKQKLRIGQELSIPDTESGAVRKTQSRLAWREALADDETKPKSKKKRSKVDPQKPKKKSNSSQLRVKGSSRSSAKTAKPSRQKSAQKKSSNKKYELKAR